MSKKNISLGILRQRREQLGFSINDVIDMLSERSIELSAKALYGYENGVGTPKVTTFIALCDIYGIHDVLGSFGYDRHPSLVTCENEWDASLYNDFFNASLLDKIYILLKNGIPSFSGYEEKLDSCFSDNAQAAYFDKLFSICKNFNETQQKMALIALDEISRNHQPHFSQDGLDQKALEFARQFSDLPEDVKSWLISSMQNKTKDNK